MVISRLAGSLSERVSCTKLKKDAQTINGPAAAHGRTFNLSRDGVRSNIPVKLSSAGKEKCTRHCRVWGRTDAPGDQRPGERGANLPSPNSTEGFAWYLVSRVRYRLQHFYFILKKERPQPKKLSPPPNIAWGFLTIFLSAGPTSRNSGGETKGQNGVKAMWIGGRDTGQDRLGPLQKGAYRYVRVVLMSPWTLCTSTLCTVMEVVSRLTLDMEDHSVKS